MVFKFFSLPSGRVYRWESVRPVFLVFLSVFTVIFSSLKLGTNSGSSGNVEQWMNLTNQTLYGEQDFLFSYGPLYWLVGGVATPYNVYTYWISTTFLSVVCAAFWSMLANLMVKGRSYILPAIAFFLFFRSLNFPAALYLWSFLAVVCLEFRRENVSISSAILMMLGFFVGLFVYVRFFYGLVGAAAIGSYLFCRVIGKRSAIELVVFLSALAVAYIALGSLVFHNFVSVIDYLLVNKNLSFGNSVDMTLDVVNSKKTFFVVGGIAALLNIYFFFMRRTLLLTANVLFLIFFKLGFSRADHYVPYFVVSIAVLGLVMAFEKGVLGRALYIMVAVGLSWMIIVPSYPGAPTKISYASEGALSADYKQRMKNIYYPAYGLGQDVLSVIGSSTIDIYPYNNEYAFANDLNYKHRPSFQNYMTLTPALDGMNQRFFESPSRPMFLLWSGGISCRFVACNVFDGFDQKYALSEDPLTSTSIFLNYHPVGLYTDNSGVPLMLLRENDSVTPYAEHIVSSVPMEFGRWYSVPSSRSGAVKILPDFKFSLYGRLKNLLFRGSILKIKYRLAYGEVREYRVNIINSVNGVWVSPYINSFDLAGVPVEAIMFESDSSEYFKPHFVAKWVVVDIPNIKVKPADFAKAVDVAREASREVKEACDGSIDIINGGHPIPTHLELSEMARVQGWLAASGRKGTLMDKLLVSLTDLNGRRTFLSTSTELRRDVAEAFKQTELMRSGFNTLLDLSEVHGIYSLGLAGIKDHVLYTCEQFTIPVTIH